LAIAGSSDTGTRNRTDNAYSCVHEVHSNLRTDYLAKESMQLLRDIRAGIKPFQQGHEKSGDEDANRQKQSRRPNLQPTLATTSLHRNPDAL
jgi:hypothetical protein